MAGSWIGVRNNFWSEDVVENITLGLVEFLVVTLLLD